MVRRTIQERLEAEREKLDQQKAKVAHLQARLREKQCKQSTRRKVLAGTMVLEHMETDAEFKEWFESELEEFLTHDSDRKLFGFEPSSNLKETSKEPEEPLEELLEEPIQLMGHERDSAQVEGDQGELEVFCELEAFNMYGQPLSIDEINEMRRVAQLDCPSGSPAKIDKSVQLLLDARHLLFQNLTVSYEEPPRQGRNEPCACGSGRKYKKCCLRAR